MAGTTNLERSAALPLIDDGRRIAEADKEQVQDESAGPAVPNKERMNLLKACTELFGRTHQI